MSEKSRSAREERLRAVLREGDPAGAEPGPALEEVRRMRRAVLSAVAEPRRGFWMPVVVTAAAAALTLAMVLGLWRARTDPMTASGTVQAVRTPAPSAPTPAPAREEMAAAPVVEPVPHARGPRVEAPPPALPSPGPAPFAPIPEEDPEQIHEEGPAAEPDSSLPPEDLPLRQVQFAAPGGTRVIWMLSAEAVVEESAE